MFKHQLGREIWTKMWRAHLFLRHPVSSKSVAFFDALKGHKQLGVCHIFYIHYDLDCFFSTYIWPCCMSYLSPAYLEPSCTCLNTNWVREIWTKYCGGHTYFCDTLYLQNVPYLWCIERSQTTRTYATYIRPITVDVSFLHTFGPAVHVHIYLLLIWSLLHMFKHQLGREIWTKMWRAHLFLRHPVSVKKCCILFIHHTVYVHIYIH